MVTKGVFPSQHLVNNWEMKMGKETFDLLPSITQTKVSWSSESAASHPDPSRSSTIISGPRIAMEALGLDLNQGMRMFVMAKGLDANLSPVWKNVAYMEGLTDGIELARIDSKGTRFATMPHTVSVSESSPDVAIVFRPDGLIDVTNTGDVAADAHLMVKTRFSSSAGHVTQGRYASGPVKYAGMVRTDRKDMVWGNDVLVGPSNSQTLTLAGGVATHSFPVRVLNMQAGQTVTIMVVGVEQPGRASMGALERLEATVVASDYLATLGRLTIGDEPWDFRRVSDRIYYDLGPLAEASGVYVDYAPRRQEGFEPGGIAMVDSNYVRPLDVDSRSALDVYRLTCASVGRVALGLAGRVGMSWALKPAYRMTYTTDQAVIVPNPDSTMIPSEYVPDAPVAKTADKVATKINVTWWQPGPEYDWQTNKQDVVEKNFILTNPTAIKQYGVIERKVETHQFTTRMDYTLQDIAPELLVKAQLMLDEQSTPEWYFSEDTRVIPRNLDKVQGLAEIIDNATRFGRVVRFVGPMPNGVDDSHRCIGGSFGYDGEDWRLELELEPAYYSGTDTAKFFQAKPKADLTFDVLRSSLNGDGTGPITYSEMRNTAL